MSGVENFLDVESQPVVATDPPPQLPDKDFLRAVDKYINRLGKRNPLRFTAGKLAEGTPPETLTVLATAYLKLLHWTWTNRIVAAWCLGAIPNGQASADEAVDLLHHGSKQEGFRMISRGFIVRYLARWGFFAFFMCAVSFGLSYNLFGRGNNQFSAQPILAMTYLFCDLTVVGLASGAITLLYGLRSKRAFALLGMCLVPLWMFAKANAYVYASKETLRIYRESYDTVAGTLISISLLVPLLPFVADRFGKHAYRAMSFASLKQLNSMDSIGFFSRGLFENNDEVHKCCYLWLRENLCKIGPKNYGTFDSGTISAITRILTYYTHELVLDAVRALEFIGTARCMPQLKRTATYHWDEEVRLAAEKTLETIIKRTQEETQGSRLLLPSSNPDNPAETLLRPAKAGDADASLLLRIPSED
ncbi:MAG: hypothetical protein ABJA67_11650 [Chthonomonadales bacterium]